MTLQESIKEILLNTDKPISEEELYRQLEIDPQEAGTLCEVLDELVEEGYIIKTKKDKYALPELMNLVTGRIQANPRGFGFLIPHDKTKEDVFIAASDLKGAMHGDRVIVRYVKSRKQRRSRDGEVIRILKRANSEVVGIFESSKSFGFVVVDEKKIKYDVYIPKGETMGAKDGDKVVVEITKWPEARRNPEGKVIEVLGQADDPGVDVLAIIRKFNLPENFPKKVQDEADAVSETVSQEEIAKRRDLRGMNIITIDGADAKDLDDAIAVEKLDNGNYRLSVHIADVTHYVKEGSELDKEAYKRATSVYLVDRVIPMLPRRLSNGICSLNPAVDRLTMSCSMEIDPRGQVVHYEIFESVIKTKARMTYKDVSDIIEHDDAELKKKYDFLVEDFEAMKELSKILTRRKDRRGSIDFDFPEAKIMLDEDGNPVDIKKAERRTANKIIEEFMIVTNETIAEHVFWLNMPFVYRVHEVPDPGKIADFNKFIHNFGYHLKGTAEEIHPKALQDLLRKIEGKREEHVISTLMLRSLRQARYSPENLGHFGLASKYYCHFTSPIRRYPDLQIHRILKYLIHSKVDEKMKEHLTARVVYAAEQSSEKERIAVEAERETNDLKMTEYMVEHVGEEFDGIISSVLSFGFFVELDNTVEGLIRVSSLDDDYYIFDEENYLFRGERTKKKYRLGDDVRIKVDRADVMSKEIDFSLVKEK